MTRRNIAAGNWKMNNSYDAGMELVRSLSKADIPSDVEVVLGIPYVFLKDSIEILENIPSISVAAQNCHFQEKGAYTGEISAEMLASILCPYVILGHSERRQYFKESNEELAINVNTAFSQNLKVIFCCGEPLDIRKACKQNKFVCNQLEESLFHLSSSEIADIVIAYEPIWAIGTGETASPEQAQDMHKNLREHLAKKYGEEIANQIPILYGGSVKSANAKEIFSQNDVDGGLVGGASLDAEHFEKIINSFS